MTAKVLIIDDEPDLRWVLASMFRDAGFEVHSAGGADEALALSQQVNPDVVLSDVRMPGRDGLQLMTELRQLDRDLPVILLTAVDDVAKAVEAMKHGAYDFLSKPFDRARLLRTVERAAEKSRLRREVEQLRQQNRPLEFSSSTSGKALQHQLRLVAEQDRVNVLLQGESGTGKELAARNLHGMSSRRHGPFVAVDCGALPEPLLESQLFGHVKGAFTGADRDRPGLFRMAHGGTLFLDELGNLPLALQTKLLRALQERSVVPVGSSEAQQFDARLVAATNVDLLGEVGAGRFRIDLYHRIAEFVVTIPPLRQRTEDLPDMARVFLLEACSDTGRRIRGFTPAALDLLRKQAWPGNVRELRNAIRRATILCAGDELDLSDFATLRADTQASCAEVSQVVKSEPLPGSSLSERLRSAAEQLERQILHETLARWQGNKAAAARELKIDYTTLHRKLKRHGL